MSGAEISALVAVATVGWAGFCLPTYFAARLCDDYRAAWALLPGGNLLVVFWLADQSAWRVLYGLIPFIGAFSLAWVYIGAWMAICEYLRINRNWGSLCILPFGAWFVVARGHPRPETDTGFSEPQANNVAEDATGRVAGKEIRLSAQTLVLGGVCLVLLIVVSVLATYLATRGSNAVPAADSRPEPRVEATAGDTATATPTLTPTLTASPTRTPTPVPTPTNVPVQILNGTELGPGGNAGDPGYLTVKNGTTQDALVKLVDASTKHTARSVYVVRQSDWTIPGIAPGTYIVRFSAGNDWDPVDHRFQKSVSFKEFESPLDFTISNDQFSYWSITLNAVPGGTAEIAKIDAATFYTD